MQENNFKMTTFQMGRARELVSDAVHGGIRAGSEQLKGEILLQPCIPLGILVGLSLVITTPVYQNSCGFGWVPCVIGDQTEVLVRF